MVAVLVGAAGWANADKVVVYYEAEAVTVVGDPFGIDVPRLTKLTGTFKFNTSAQDDDPDDVLFGSYPHAGGNGGFRADFLDTTITGSVTPYVSVQVGASQGGSDTFRFIDGPRAFDPQGGVMSIAGSPDPDIQLRFSATDELFADGDDSLVNPFPLIDLGHVGTPHTFALEDDQGTLLNQLTLLITLSDLACGDLDGNGSISASDSLRLLRGAVGNEVQLFCPDPDGAGACGDLDGNGSVSAGDSLRLLRKAVGQDVSLVCPA